jgi:hypothetical protein
MVDATGAPQFIPSPPISGFRIGLLDVHFYALGYVIGFTLAILLTRRRWRALGGDPDLVGDIALWVVPAGIVGGRIYFDVTTPMDIPHVWYGPFAVWTGGLGIWGGVALAVAAGVWRLRRAGLTAGLFANAVAPALLVAQAVDPGEPRAISPDVPAPAVSRRRRSNRAHRASARRRRFPYLADLAVSQVAEGEVARGLGVRAGEELPDGGGEFRGVEDAVAVEVKAGEGMPGLGGAGPVRPGVLSGFKDAVAVLVCRVQERPRGGADG